MAMRAAGPGLHVHEVANQMLPDFELRAALAHALGSLGCLRVGFWVWGWMGTLLEAPLALGFGCFGLGRSSK